MTLTRSDAMPASRRPAWRRGLILGLGRCAAAVGVVFVAIVAAGTVVWFDGGSILGWAIETYSEPVIGRQVRLGGPLTTAWGRETQIVAEDIHVANAAWGSDPEMFAARRLEIDLDLFSLFSGPAHVRLISLDGATLLLERSKDGQVNWSFLLASGVPQQRSQSPDLTRFQASDSLFTWHDATSNATTRLHLNELGYDAPDPAQPIAIAWKGKFQGLSSTGNLTGGPLAALRDPETPYPVKLAGKIDAVTIAVDGTVAEPLDAAGIDAKLSLDGRNLHGLAAALGVPMPELPKFHGTAKISGGGAKWNLDAINLTVGSSDLAGGIEVATADRVPSIEANLTSSRLSIADFAGAVGAAPPGQAAPTKEAETGRVLPDTALDVGKLPGINAALSFYGGHVVSATGLPLDNVTLALAIKDGTLTVQPLRFHAASGDVDLSLQLTPAASGPPHVAGEIDVRHIDLHKLLSTSASARVRQTAGIIGGRIKLDSTGASVRTLLARMNGEAGLSMENGQLSELYQQLAPINVLGALGVLASGDRPLPINCFVSHFTVASGRATATNFLFDTKEAFVTGTGTINFADETLDLKLVPKNKTAALVSLRTPVTIVGTFAKPDYHIESINILGRLGASVGLGVLFPPAALLPLLDTGNSETDSCLNASHGQPTPHNAAPDARPPRASAPPEPVGGRNVRGPER